MLYGFAFKIKILDFIRANPMGVTTPQIALMVSHNGIPATNFDKLTYNRVLMACKEMQKQGLCTIEKKRSESNMDYIIYKPVPTQ